MPDYIPGPDESFGTFFQSLNIWMQANGTTHGLSAAQLLALDDAYALWSTSFDAHVQAQTAATAAAQTKDTARAAAEVLIRLLARIVQVFPATTDADRAAAGLTVRDTSRTSTSVPTSRPVLMVDNSQRLVQTVNYKDETTPNSKKKPDGVMGCEFRCYIGDTPPADPEDYEFWGLAMKSPFRLVHDGANATKNAHIVACWVNTHGEKGPWSETVMATISA
jgi:hypothetical protein